MNFVQCRVGCRKSEANKAGVEIGLGNRGVALSRGSVFSDRFQLPAELVQGFPQVEMSPAETLPQDSTGPKLDGRKSIVSLLPITHSQMEMRPIVARVKH